MSASQSFQVALMNHLLTNQALAGVGDSAGLQPSAAAGSLYVALHTADPGEAGNQDANEATYAGYARVAVARSSAGWTVAGLTGQSTNAADIQFPAATAAGGTVTFFSVGVAASGSTLVLISGALATPLTIDNGVIPVFTTGQLTLTVD